MNKTAYIVQFDSFQPIIGSSSVAAYLKGQGFNRVAFKVLDAASWEGTRDRSSDGIRGLESITSWVKDFTSYGLAVDVWVNVHKDNLDRQIALWQQIRALAGIKRFILDTEPYADFWGDESACSVLVPTIHQLDLSITFDVRRLEWPGIGACLDAAEYQMPQLYDASWIGAAIASEQGHPHAVLEPLVPSWTGVDVWKAVLQSPLLGSTRGRSGLGVFSVPLTSQTLVQALGELD